MVAVMSAPEFYGRLRGLPGPVQTVAAQCLTQLGFEPAPPVVSRSPEDEALYHACQTDVARFAREFFPHLCTVEFSQMHRDFFADYKARHGLRGQREATAAPRGNAKTTIKGLIKLIHDCVYRHERFIVVISSRRDMAQDKVQEVRDELEENAALRRVFGKQVGRRWNKHDFITSQGVRVLAASRRSQIRGLVWRGLRPTKILLDDAERSDEVLSETQREKFWLWYTSDIAKLGGPDTNYEVIGTVLHPESMLARLLVNPGYRTRRYQAIIQYADQAPELWQQWRELFCNLDDPERMETARAFFDQHSEQMLAGHKVLWPQRESYYDLMVMIVVEGITAFELEKQNNPLGAADLPFDMDSAAYFTLEPYGILRPGKPLLAFTDLVRIDAFWDPAMGGKDGEPDWSCCTVVGRDAAGYTYVLDCYLGQHDKPGEQVEGVADLLWRWQVQLTGIESNGFQSLLVPNLKEALAQRALDDEQPWTGRFVEVKNLKNKPQRIMTMEPLVANHWLQFNGRLPGEFFRQFRDFRPLPDAGKDDAPDSTEGAVRVSKGLFDKRAAAG